MGQGVPHVLWAYCTTPMRSTGKTTFYVTYGVEAMIPVKVGLSSMRVSNVSP